MPPDGGTPQHSGRGSRVPWPKRQRGPLASSKQAAATRPSEPLAAPEQQGSRNRGKKLPRYPGWCSDDKQSPLGAGRPVYWPPKCSKRPSGRARGRPQAGPKWPKITENGPRCLRGGRQKVLLSKLMDKIDLGPVWGAFWLCLDPCGPEPVSVGAKMGSFGPRM